MAETGSLPVLQPGDWDGALLERLKASRFRSGDPVDGIRYEAWQPPLYYLLAAPVYLASPPPARLDALRLLSVALGGLSLLVGYLVARDLLPDREALALAVPLAMVGVPMFTAMSAAVTNDALANLLAALLTLLALRTLRRPPSRRWSLVVGVALGAGLLTKLSLVVYLPLALAALAWSGWRTARATGPAGAWRLPLAAPLLAGAVALAVWAPWLVRNGLTYGWDDLLASRRHDAVVLDQPRFPGFTPEHLSYLATTTFHSFWAQFGWMAFPVDDRLYWTWGLLTLGALAGLVRVGGSARCRLDRRWLVAVASAAAMLAALAGYNLAFIQAQGRYLFPALVSLIALAVLGWSGLAPRAVRAWVPLGIAAALVVLNAVTLVRYAAPALRG